MTMKCISLIFPFSAYTRAPEKEWTKAHDVFFFRTTCARLHISSVRPTTTTTASARLSATPMLKITHIRIDRDDIFFYITATVVCCFAAHKKNKLVKKNTHTHTHRNLTRFKIAQGKSAQAKLYMCVCVGVCLFYVCAHATRKPSTCAHSKLLPLPYCVRGQCMRH